MINSKRVGRFWCPFPSKSFGTNLRKCLHGTTCRAASGKADESNEVSQMPDAKPFSSLPYAGSRNWISNVLQLIFTRGGLHKSLFKFTEEASRDVGPIARRASGKGDDVWIFDPQDVATVLRADSKYPERFSVPIMDVFYKRRSKEPGVFFLNGQKWRKHKLLLSQKMLRPLQINQYIPRINCIALEMVECLSRARDSKTLEVDQIDMELFKWSFETVADFLFDRRFHSLGNDPPEKALNFIKAIGHFLDSFLPTSFLPPGAYKYYETKAYKSFDSNFMLLYQFSEELIADKLADIAKRAEMGESIDPSKELIPFLLASGKVSEKEVGSSIVDTLFAGVDTTSNTMQWMLYLLAKNPDVQSRIREEIRTVLPRGEEPSAESLQQLFLVKAAIKETLRLYPVLIITGRILEKDVVLSGYHIPAKQGLMFMNHAMGRSEEIFTNATEFEPERWLRTTSNSKADAFASLPFGHGVRMCLGRRLAELELQILLVQILSRYVLDLPPGHVVDNYFRGVNIPDRPIRVRFHDIEPDRA